MAIEFKNADDAYFAWVESHQKKGFLLNRGKANEPHDYPKLHKASCIFVNKPLMFHPTSTTYFIMIWDSTALTSTYQAGRYLRAPIADSTGWTVIDFNRTYNPGCVFSDFSVCGLPPEENRMPFALPAGEMRPEGTIF